jgi:hypothetical protein
MRKETTTTPQEGERKGEDETKNHKNKIKR